MATVDLRANPAVAATIRGEMRPTLSALMRSKKFATDAIAASEERPEREVFDQEDVIAGDYSMTITIDQDVHYLRDMQAGMHSQGFKAAWLGEDETRVQHFHDWVGVWVSGNPLAKGQKHRDAAE